MLRCGMVGSPACTCHLPGRPGSCSGWPSSAPRCSIGPAQPPPKPRLPPAPAGEAGPAPGAAAPGGDLRTVEVTQHPVHAVPEGDAAPPPPVTIKGRDGSVTALRAPPVPARYSPGPAPVTRISGAARVADVVSLSVLGRAVRLFGVRPPQASDLCPASESAAPLPCSEAPRAALAVRLAANPHLVCRVPPGQRAPVPAAGRHHATRAHLRGLPRAGRFALS